MDPTMEQSEVTMAPYVHFKKRVGWSSPNFPAERGSQYFFQSCFFSTVVITIVIIQTGITNGVSS